MFFKICVSRCGRFIRSDECTVDRVRLDYARVLISTTSLEVINLMSKVVIDECKYMIKLVEEWGCNLGEDAFLSEEEIESTTEALSNHNDAPGMEEVQGYMDDLVDELSKEWLNQDEHKDGNDYSAAPSMHAYVNCTTKVVKRKHGKRLVGSIIEKGEGVNQGISPKDVLGSCSAKEGVKITSKFKTSTSSKHKKKKKVGVSLKHSARFIKRIARLPSQDRKEILKVLKKHECKRGKLSKDSKVMVNSLFNSSNSSNSSVNKD